MTNEDKIKEIIDGTLPNYCPSGYSVMISRGDMESMLEKMAKHKDEQHESDRLFLEEYKSRCEFYVELIKYLYEECAGDKNQIIEAVSTNEKNEFIGYVETEKEIDNNGNLIFKFKVEDMVYRAYWQQDDNYAVCQWTGYEPDDYYGYMLFPTYNFKKFFCIYYKC